MTAEIKEDASISPEIEKYLAILSKAPGSMVFAPLAEAYRKAGMLDEAVSTAQDGLKHHPNYVSGMVALARAYFDKGMTAEAREMMEKVLVIAPDNIVAKKLIEEIENYKSAVSGQKAGGAKEAEPVETHEEIATASEYMEEEQAGEFPEIAEVEELEADEEVVSTFGEEITEELWTGEAISEHTDEEKAEPKKGITTETIAQLYIRQGYIDKAVDIYQTLFDANPYDEQIKRKLDELKQQLPGGVNQGPEVAGQVEEVGGGWMEPSGHGTEVVSGRQVEHAAESMEPAEEETLVDDNIKKLESWLKNMQSERRKV